MFILWLSLFSPLISALIHHLFVGNLQLPASIHLLEFDDEASTLFRINTFSADSSHAWIAFDASNLPPPLFQITSPITIPQYQKANIYGASLNAKRIASYSINNDLNVHLEKTVNATGDCVNQTSAFALPASSPPYDVYTGSWPGPNGCGMGISVFENGTLSHVTQTWKYNSSSGIHGLAAAGKNMYTADLSGDAIWTHKIDKDGNVELVARYEIPKKGMHPRHVAAHPGGGYIYVVMEAANEIVVYSVNEAGVIQQEAGTYPLIPDQTQTKAYWSAEITLSHTNTLLWATSRATQNSNNTGFISLFALDFNGNITKQIFTLPTTTTNGIANAVSPAGWSDEFMALTDFPRGYVQIWQLVRAEGVWVGASMVAQVGVGDGGCCANVIWYD